MTKNSSSIIAKVDARQVFDSRGRPTVEVDVRLEDGSFGRAMVPSGASTGRHEACELRDGNPEAFEGRGVLRAVANVAGELAQHIVGMDAQAQAALDGALIDLDGTPNLGRIGANAVLGVSMATCRAAAVHRGQPLYRYIASLIGEVQPLMPMPMVNILSGGAHAGRGMDVQDFLAVPVGASSYSQAIDMVVRVRNAAERLMKDMGLSTLLAEEGGLSPRFSRADDALQLLVRSIQEAGLRPGRDVAIAIDVAASELLEQGAYELKGEGRRLSGEQMVEFLADWTRNYPVVSVEDGLDQDDWKHWAALTATLSSIQVVGDDLFVTNEQRIRQGVERGVGNAVLIKLNQNGTLTGTLKAMQVARKAGYATVVSARSGETEDSFIADLSVGTGSGQIKVGSVRSSERLAKYNQLLRIEQDGLEFAGMRGYAPLPRAR